MYDKSVWEKSSSTAITRYQLLLRRLPCGFVQRFNIVRTTRCNKNINDRLVDPYLLGCPTFWRLLRKNKSSRSMIGFSSLISKMTSFFNYDVILKCHLADFMLILTYLENDKSQSDETCMKMTRRVDFRSRLFTLLKAVNNPANFSGLQ